MRYSIPFALLLCLLLQTGCTSTMSEADASRRFMEIRNMSSNRGPLTVVIEGIDEELGDVRVGLYDASLPFPKEGIHLVSVNQAARPGTNTVVFDDVPAGEYAIAVIHDRDRNGHLNKTLGVFPSEPIGFSGGAQAGAFGPPSFKEAAFTFAPGQQPVRVQVTP